ncbi:unnamed protein product [Rhizophagus irregularis]|nr:unnamed protein product [Rhizophagus irregularis]
MVKKNKKTLHKFPSFQPAVSLDLDRDDAQAKASYYREKAKVRNTEKSTKNWITKFEEFRVCANYSVPLSELDDVSLLQQQLVEYISTMKRNDDGHDGLQFFRYTSKNNQRGIQGGKAQIISIPADDSGPCTDIKYYLSKRPDLSDDNFYLQPNPSWLENGIWYKTSHIGKNRLNKFMQNIGRELLSNHSGRKTATQVLQDEEIPEQAIMQLTGHKSVQGVRAYKTINEEQQLNLSSVILINVFKVLSSKQNNSSSQDNSINDNVEITKSRVPLQEISLSANSLGNEVPIFQNCTFSNVSFYIQK